MSDASIELHGSIDQLPALSVNPPGVLVLTRHWNADETWLTVKRADPYVDFTDELLRALTEDGGCDMYPDVELVPNYRHNIAECRLDDRCFNGFLVHIYGRDRTVIYRIGAYSPSRNVWRAVWPD